MLPAVEFAPARTDVDPVLVLAEVMTRLRHAGLPMPSDRLALDAAYGHLSELLVALGVPVSTGGNLDDRDWLLLLCIAAPRCGDGALGA